MRSLIHSSVYGMLVYDSPGHSSPRLDQGQPETATEGRVTEVVLILQEIFYANRPQIRFKAQLNNL